jgi:hypothetical protein
MQKDYDPVNVQIYPGRDDYHESDQASNFHDHHLRRGTKLANLFHALHEPPPDKHIVEASRYRVYRGKTPTPSWYFCIPNPVGA